MTDRFGNEIDPRVGYARGRVLSDALAEAARTAYGRNLVRQRLESHGEAGFYNLTGLIRGFPVPSEALPKLRSQFHYYANFDGWPERAAVDLMGGDPERHGGFMLNRVSAATLAMMGAVLEPGDDVLSVVPRGRSHPSVERAVTMVGGRLRERVGLEGLEALLAEVEQPKLAVITPITHQKFSFELEELVATIEALGGRSVPVFLDDAHMSARVGAHGHPRSFELGPVAASVVSTDKHMQGPRAAAFAARKDIVSHVRAFAFAYGLEAQSGHAVAAAVAIEHHDAAPIAEAARTGRRLLDAMQARYGDKVYSTGVGAAIGEEDILSIASTRAADPVRIAPVDAANVLAMSLLEHHGIATIPSVGMPGSSPALRLMTFPDGARCGVPTLIESVEAALDEVASVIDDHEAAAARILGAATASGSGS